MYASVNVWKWAKSWSEQLGKSEKAGKGAGKPKGRSRAISFQVSRTL